MSVTRRTFLKLGASGMAGSALASAGSLLPGGIHTLDRVGNANLFLDYPESYTESVCGACPCACRVLLRRVDGKIVGVRPLEPKPCPRAYAIPQELYHPDRLLTARRRLRGQDMWQTLYRGAALQEVTELLRHSGSRIAFVLREDNGLSFALFAALANALHAGFIGILDSPRSQLSTDALETATRWSNWRPDLAQATAVASFGLDWLQAYPDPAAAQQAFSALRASNAPMITIGPRLDRTAMKSQYWLPCRPGSEPLVALAAAHCILKSGRYDRDGCGNAEGFQDFADALSAFDLPGSEKTTGVVSRKIEELANMLASRQPVCIGPRRRMEDQWPIVALNALLGRINKPGGWVPLPDVGLDIPGGTVIQNGETLPDLILHGDRSVLPEGIETVILAGVNPAFSSPSPRRWRAAFKGVSNVICASTFMDETAALSDLVLPLALPAEAFETYLRHQEDGTVQARRIEAARTPPGDVISLEDLVFELARRLDLDRDRFPWRDHREAAASVASRRPEMKPFRFMSSMWSPPPFSGGGYHLLFEIPGTLPRMEGGHLPYLLTTVGPHLREWWTTWAEVNPHTAERLGLRDRDVVRLESDSGSIVARVKLFAGVPPEAICVPLGMGHRSGTFGQAEGGNPAELVAFRADEATGVPIWDFQKVQIGKA